MKFIVYEPLKSIKYFRSRAIGLNTSRDRIFPSLTWGMSVNIPPFSKLRTLRKRFEGYKHKSIHLARKCARIFVLAHNLFLEAHSYPRATLLDKCPLLGTDNARGQLSQHLFAQNRGYCLHTRDPG